MLAYPILVAAVVFWPVLIIAMIVLRSPLRAFALAASFTLGSMAGSALSLWAAGSFIGQQSGDARTINVFAFAALGAIAGGLIGAYLAGKLAGRSLWRRS